MEEKTDKLTFSINFIALAMIFYIIINESFKAIDNGKFPDKPKQTISGE